MEPAKRHAIAHAGFNKKFIELKRIGNEIRVRVYRARENDVLRILDNLFNQNLVIETKSAKHPESKQ